MSSSSWKEELDVRPRKRPLALSTFPEGEERDAEEERRKKIRLSTQKCRAKMKQLEAENGSQKDHGRQERNKKYKKMHMRDLRVKKKQREAENDMESQADARIPDMDPPPAQPTPPTFPLVRDLTIPNASFPIQSKVVMWPGGGYKTRLPWVSDPNDPEINLLLDDENHVRNLSKTAKPADECAWVVNIVYQHYQDDEELSKVIREHISKGNVVVLKGYPFKPAELTVKTIWKEFKIPKNRTVEALDAVLRAKPPAGLVIHKSMTLEKFCEGTTDTSRVQCVLDCPSVDGDKISLIKFMDDAHSVWFQLHQTFPSRKFAPLDVQKSSSWILFHQALFHTYTHHDADGYATWTQVLSGEKFWVVTRPRGLEEVKTRKDFYDASEGYLSPDADKNGFYGEGFERFVIYATPGDVIFQPPGTFHEVYTPTPSITRGGHFYSYDSLHLTEFSRSIDARTRGAFSNQTHPSVYLTLHMMMAALPIVEIFHIPEKSLKALCRMILHPSDYDKGCKDPDVVYLNIELPKKKRIQKMPDVAFGESNARLLKKAFKFDLGVSHNLDKYDGKDDFIFEGDSWLDPGPLVDFQESFAHIKLTDIDSL